MQLTMYRRVLQARNEEIKRFADLIEVAMCAAETDETRQALLDLATKVLRP